MGAAIARLAQKDYADSKRIKKNQKHQAARKQKQMIGRPALADKKTLRRTVGRSSCEAITESDVEN